MGASVSPEYQPAWMAARAAIPELNPEPEERQVLLHRGGIRSKWMKTDRIQDGAKQGGMEKSKKLRVLSLSCGSDKG